MSTDTGAHGKRVVDEEGTVDQKIKERIISARERVDEREDWLFIEAATNPSVNISQAQQVVYWGTAVRQFLRSIEPLLKSDEVEQSQHYYREVELGEVTLIPQDVGNYEFSKVAYAEYDDDILKQQLGLPRDVTLPEVRRRRFVGLKSLIEAENVLKERWVVKTDTSGPPPQHTHVETETRQPVPKRIYEDAVREADAFLQRAGVGLNIGTEEVDDHSEPW